MYLNYKDGFYVYKFKSLIALIKYVCRYVARPVMAESRIINYDGTYVSFRQIRFYGIYHNSTIVKIDLKRIWSKEYSNYKKKSLNWRNMINKDL